MSNWTIVAAAGGLLLSVVSCGVIAAALPPTMPLGGMSIPVTPARMEAGRALYMAGNLMASGGAVVDAVTDRIASPGLGGDLAVSAGGPLTVELYVRSTLEGCSAVPGGPAWSCPVTAADLLETVQLGASTVTAGGPWYGEAVTRAVRAHAVYVGVRVVSGSAPDGATLTASVDLLTR